MTVYLNGDYLPIEQAHISPLDRGFLFGDGIYEVIPAYANTLFRCEQHLDRLQSSLDGIRIQNPHTQQEWIAILDELIRIQPHQNHSIYLQITRGCDVKRDHSFPSTPTPTVFAMSTELKITTDPVQSNGVSAITRQDNRWEHCDIKAITLLPNILLRQQATDVGSAETILIRNDQVIEGAASNVFIVKHGIIKTPAKSNRMLTGVTRDLILEIANQKDIEADEETISRDELFSADEVWLTSSTKEILPVTSIDDQKIGNGEPGNLWKMMSTYYAEYKQELVSGNIQ